MNAPIRLRRVVPPARPATRTALPPRDQTCRRVRSGMTGFPLAMPTSKRVTQPCPKRNHSSSSIPRTCRCSQLVLQRTRGKDNGSTYWKVKVYVQAVTNCLLTAERDGRRRRGGRAAYAASMLWEERSSRRSLPRSRSLGRISFCAGASFPLHATRDDAIVECLFAVSE